MRSRHSAANDNPTERDILGKETFHRRIHSIERTKFRTRNHFTGRRHATKGIFDGKDT